MLVLFMQGMLWEVSLLDAEEGIRLRGYTIAELQVLPLWCMPSWLTSCT